MLDDNKQYYLQQMGIDSWVERQTPKTPSLAELEKIVSVCTKCPLHQSRQKTVFARGNPQATLMIIGEAPGFNEDKQGLPFVGKAGLLLNNMLDSIGLSEQDVYIVNVIKCRPPDNRPPKNDEITQCSPYLTTQITQVSPSLLLALGRFAGQFVANELLPLKQLRQKSYTYQTIPCVISYHPAYLLRNPVDKKLAYHDLLVVRRKLNVLI
jgi:uracil-DNA glycosylase family 4